MFETIFSRNSLGRALSQMDPFVNLWPPPWNVRNGPRCVCLQDHHPCPCQQRYLKHPSSCVGRKQRSCIRTFLGGCCGCCSRYWVRSFGKGQWSKFGNLYPLLLRSKGWCWTCCVAAVVSGASRNNWLWHRLQSGILLKWVQLFEEDRLWLA